ncbi:MAG: hypothetical protein KKH02_12440 [Proteobacteria bacterium]|nr:hypothetical protein [Pseudomonadota bacterium]MBU4583197.1 hypothetical protein [Pseudomonadota bacterium]MCG2740401.1 hypothetical protein [Syntrophaceae bacterium]
MRKHGGIIFFGLMILVLSGCASVGPGSVSRDRFDYNATLTESWKRQILVNIVKIRYVEPVFFVDVGQIVAGYSLETGINAGGAATLSNFNTSVSIETGLSGKYTDRPTITYVPMTGNAFVKSMLTPFSPENMMFAVQSGIPADMLFKLGVASINGLRNRSAPIAGFRPAEQKFLRVVDVLRSLQISGAIHMKTIKGKDNQASSNISFWSKGATAEIASQVRELCDLLGLDPGADKYRLVYGIVPENNREIAIQTFPMMHLLSFLAARVEVPEEDIREGRASPGVREAKGITDNNGRFGIKCSDSKPQDAFVSVAYRNRWFWVDDRDLESKRAISLIMLIFTLTDTGKQESLPQITIPAQ